MFRMTEVELEDWKSQTVISNKEKMGLRRPPNVFTEQGVAMLSSVLNSETAIEVNIQIIRIFSRLREAIVTNKDIFLRLAQFETKILQQDNRARKQEQEIQLIFKALKQLLTQPKKARTPIGFKIPK
jgi:hypothetical protein